MAEPARLALGSAQFGMPYGLTEGADQASGREIGSILVRAAESGVDLVDTAAAYGDAERQLGIWCPASRGLAYVTKTPPIQRSRVTEHDAAASVARARESLRHLRAKSLYGLLVHAAGDLLASGGERLYDALRGLKEQGDVAKLGVSVYDIQDLEDLLARYPLDIVQLPLNVFDQRFAKAGLIRDLALQGIEVHVRSVYLQGLLLRKPDDIPARLAHAAGDVARFHAAASRGGLSPLQAALAFVVSTPGVARVILGVDSVEMLDASLLAYEAIAHVTPSIEYDAFGDISRTISDPRRWAPRPTVSATVPTTKHIR